MIAFTGTGNWTHGGIHNSLSHTDFRKQIKDSGSDKSFLKGSRWTCVIVEALHKHGDTYHYMLFWLRWKGFCFRSNHSEASPVFRPLCSRKRWLLNAAAQHETDAKVFNMLYPLIEPFVMYTKSTSQPAPGQKYWDLQRRMKIWFR